MKVLCASGTHPDPINPHWGVFVRNSLSSLVAEGVHVEVVSPRPSVPPFRLPPPFELFRDIPSSYDYEYPVQYPRYPYLLPKFPLYALTGLLYRRIISKHILTHSERADVVHAQFEFPDGYGIIPVAEAWKCPLVVSSHGTILRRHAHWRPESPLIRAALRHADAVCVVSEHQGKLATRIVDDPKKVVYVPLGVDTKRFNSNGRRWPGPPTLLFVGQLIRRKGLDILLKGFARVAQGNKEIQLRVVGEGSLRPWASHRAEKLDLADRITFLGGINKDALLREYSTAHALVLPSRGEGRPVVIYEAMACELPVIASNVGGVAEQVEHGVTGLLIPAGNSTALAEAIRCLTEDPQGARRMGKRGRSRIISEGWTWETHAKLLVSVYEKLVAGVPP